MVTMATVLSGAGERVWRLSGVAAMLLAERGVKGRMRMPRRVDALARSGRVRACAGMVWTSRARPGLVAAGFSLAKGSVPRVQQSKESLQDMMMHAGWERRGGWHG